MQKFNSIVEGALNLAQVTAHKHKNTQVSPYHILLGLINTPGSLCSKAFKEYKKILEDKIKSLPFSKEAISLEQIQFDSKSREWLSYASGESVQKGKEEVSEKEMLKFIKQILPEFSFNLDTDLNEEEQEVPSFLINLNERAQAGKLDPVIGRAKEIRSVMEILGRRSKNNPVLVGEAGVGKTAIIEGLAEAIVKGEISEILQDKIIYSLDLGALMAGTKFRGEFEERLQNLLKFIKSQNGKAILFIDEIHQLVGAGKTDGAMDAANLLKPALARGELNCIGATTLAEYQKYILGDGALDRRFRPVSVHEPSIEDASQILMGIRDKLEIHHGIKISDEAILQSVVLSKQYMTDKHLPDKAIDLIDEAASSLKISAESMPAHLSELEAELKSKKLYLQLESSNKEELQKEILALEDKFNSEKARWEKEVSTLKELSHLKDKKDKLLFDLEVAQRNQDYEKASQIKFSLLPEVEKELEGKQHDWILSPVHIANVISREKRIPVEKILKSKQDKILGLEKFLKSKVFGQDEAISEVADVLLTAHAGLSDETRPLGSFLLKGPSGVGKTETAKSICEFLFENTDNLIRFDLSEFSEKHSVAKLIGAPAGYIGYDEGGVLTEAVRNKPYSVILFDEVEKAHKDFSDILLQILDDGRLQDNKGRVINFKNTIILLTTNSTNLELDFKPELLGRLDGILAYKALNDDVADKLIAKELKLLNQRLKTKQTVISLNEKAIGQLKEKGISENFGARPLKAEFNRYVTRPLSKLLLEDKLEAKEYQIESVINGFEIK